MTIEYHDIVKIDRNKLNSIIEIAVEYIQNEIHGKESEIDEDETPLGYMFLAINESTLLEKLNVSGELFYNFIYQEMEEYLIIKKIEMKSNHEKLYFIYRDEMKVHKMKGCIVSSNKGLYTFHPENTHGPYFKEYKKCKIIIQEIKENNE